MSKESIKVLLLSRIKHYESKSEIQKRLYNARYDAELSILEEFGYDAEVILRGLAKVEVSSLLNDKFLNYLNSMGRSCHS